MKTVQSINTYGNLGIIPLRMLKNPSKLYNTPGTYLVSLTVFDDGGLRDEKTTYITVLDTGNQSPVAVAEADVTSGMPR
ncbi:PKD domain-containing protein [Winogradskyella maritima]|nr:PKD domain-containing protein [Winogradskyella maritima]